MHYDNYNLHCVISIHALLAESDTWQRGSRVTYVEFLSTLSLRRATGQGASNQPEQQISIHALLAESDSRPRRLKSRRMVFLSTLSLRRATTMTTTIYTALKFLSTLSLRRATCNFSQKRHPPHNFYPRSPCGERPYLSILFFSNF